MSEEKEQAGYLIQVSRQTAMAGEVIGISTNLPKGATEEALTAEVKKITHAIESRLVEVNEKVEAHNSEKFKSLGLKIPGYEEPNGNS